MTDALERLAAALAGRYTIERELGAGGMATVYLAQDRKLGRAVALKVLRPELAAALGGERFLREIEIAAKLAHPHILGLYDCGEADGLLYYTMPFVEGESLRDRLGREKQLPLDDALQITREVADALGYAHAQGLVHRDIKPENILFEAGHAVVSDFGIARAVSAAGGARLTETGLAIGTPAYMSPEQAAGSKDVDGRSDLYSLGCVLYEMLGGDPPFYASTPQAVLAKKLSEPLPRISVVREAVPASIEAALGKALARTPADRFATAQQFAAALREEPLTSPPPPVDAHRRVARRVAAVVGLVVVAISALVVRRLLIGTAEAGPPPPDRPYTVLATVGGSADSATRDAVAFLIRSGLDMAHVVQTVPVSAVQQMLTMMGRPETAGLDPATAREVAERYGVSTVVIPRLDQVGAGFVVAIRVEDAATGALRAEATAPAGNADIVVATVDAVVKELRHDLGETRAVLANTDPLPEVFTPSLEALRRFRDALRVRLSVGCRESVPMFWEVLGLDPDFAEARLSLAGCLGSSMGLRDSALAQRRRALEKPQRLTAPRRRDAEAALRYETDFAQWDERLFHTGVFLNDVNRLWTFGYADSALTLLEAALRDTVRRVRRLDPQRRTRTDGVVWLNARGAAVETGRLDELTALRESLRVEPIPYDEFAASLVALDWDRADSLWRVYGDRWGFRIDSGTMDAVRGRIREGRARASRAFKPKQTLYLEVFYGVQGTDTVLSLANRGATAVFAYTRHGVRAALVGDTSEARRVAARLRAARDSATSALFERGFEPMFATLDAGLAARRGDWRSAAVILEPVARRLHGQGYGYEGGDACLVWWVLADAYARLGRPDSAIQQLEAVLRERDGLFYYLLAYPAAHFKLGRLYAQIGDRRRAREHYAAFLKAFTDPDPEYRGWVVEARAQVAKLVTGG